MVASQYKAKLRIVERAEIQMDPLEEFYSYPTKLMD